MRQFYLAYRERFPALSVRSSLPEQTGQTPSGQLDPSRDAPLPVELSGSRWCVLLRVPSAPARQVSSPLWERLSASRDKEGVLALAREGQQVQTPADFVTDPYVLELVGLPEEELAAGLSRERVVLELAQEGRDLAASEGDDA